MGSRSVCPGCISTKTCVCLLTQVLRHSAPFMGIHNEAFMAHSFLWELKWPGLFASGTPCLKGTSSEVDFQGSGPQPERVWPSLWCWNKGLDTQTCSCVGCLPLGTSGKFSNRLCIKGPSDTWRSSLTYGDLLHIKLLGTSSVFKVKPCPASAGGLSQ